MLYVRDDQLVKDQESHFLLCYRKKPHHKTYNLHLSWNPTSLKTWFLLHDIVLRLLCYNSRKVIHRYNIQYDCPLQYFCFTFCIAFSVITSTSVSSCTYIREHVSHEYNCLCIVLRKSQSMLPRKMITNTCIT